MLELAELPLAMLEDTAAIKKHGFVRETAVLDLEFGYEKDHIILN